MSKMGFKLLLIGPVAAKDYKVELMELSNKDQGDFFQAEQHLNPFAMSSASNGKEIGLIIAPYEPAIIYAPE